MVGGLHCCCRINRGAIRRFDLDGLCTTRDGMRIFKDGELDMYVYLTPFSVQFKIFSDCNCNP